MELVHNAVSRPIACTTCAPNPLFGHWLLCEPHFYEEVLPPSWLTSFILSSAAATVRSGLIPHYISPNQVDPLLFFGLQVGKDSTQAGTSSDQLLDTYEDVPRH